MEIFLSQLTYWHWLALALVLFGLEMMTGTFDLLFISIAAFVTCVFAFFVPGDVGGWQGQILVFTIASIALIVLGRTVFADMRTGPPEHPTLNKRMTGLVGQNGVAVADFIAGQGRIKLGDTMWAAEAATGETILSGDAVRVDGAKSTTAIVSKA